MSYECQPYKFIYLFIYLYTSYLVNSSDTKQLKQHANQITLAHKAYRDMFLRDGCTFLLYNYKVF
jgi:hypothetical protein